MYPTQAIFKNRNVVENWSRNGTTNHLNEKELVRKDFEFKKLKMKEKTETERSETSTVKSDEPGESLDFYLLWVVDRKNITE